MRRVQQVMQQFFNDLQMRRFALLVCQSFVLRSSQSTTDSGPAHFLVGGTVGSVECVLKQVADVCVLAVAGPFLAVGLVDLPGRLWETDMQVPEGQSKQRFGPAGQVS